MQATTPTTDDESPYNGKNAKKRQRWKRKMKKARRLLEGGLDDIALGRIDSYLVKPWAPADDMLHPMITELLSEWTRANRRRVAMMRIVGEAWDARSHELRDLLDRNAIPYVFHSKSSEEGVRLLKETGTGAEQMPAVIFHDGTVLCEPSNVELAAALGVRTSAPPSADRRARVRSFATTSGFPEG